MDQATIHTIKLLKNKASNKTRAHVSPPPNHVPLLQAAASTSFTY